MNVRTSICFLFLICLNWNLYGQNVEFDGKWIIYDVKNLSLGNGVIKHDEIEFNKIKKISIGKCIEFTKNSVRFSDKLMKKDCFQDTISYEKFILFRKSTDNELTSNYPGDELFCDDVNCMVGETFMNLLGCKENELKVFFGFGKYPNEFSYKICIINESKLGIVFDNWNFLILIKKIPKLGLTRRSSTTFK